MNTPVSSTQNASKILRQSYGRAPVFSYFLAALLIILGVLAILMPLQSSLGVVIIVAWLMMIGAVVQIVDAFFEGGFWHIGWKIIVGLAYFVTGLFLRFHLAIGLAALTLALIGFFLVQGIVDTVIYARTRRSSGSRGVLLHGVVTILLAVMIWRHWPTSALWITGMLIGIHMIMTGTARIMLTAALGRARKSLPLHV